MAFPLQLANMQQEQLKLFFFQNFLVFFDQEQYIEIKWIMEMSMMLSARGWRRDCGTTIVTQVDLSEVTPLDEDRIRTYSSNQTYLFGNRGDGGVKIVFKGSALRLGGDYLVELRLSQDDIAHLARSTFRDMEFGAVVDLLSQRD